MIHLVIDAPHLGEVNNADFSIVFPCYNCASCIHFEFSKSTQLDPTLQLNHSEISDCDDDSDTDSSAIPMSMHIF